MNPEFSQPEGHRQISGTEDGVRLCFPNRIRGPSRQGPRLATASRDPPSSPLVGLATMHHAQDHGGFLGMEPGSHTGNRGRTGPPTTAAARDSIVTEMRCPRGADDTSKACTLRPRSSAVEGPRGLRGESAVGTDSKSQPGRGLCLPTEITWNAGQHAAGRATENNQLHGSN
jgi:hypothetical protein